MHCNQCGKENRSGSKFCRYCGTAVSEDFNIEAKIKNFSWKNPVIMFFTVLILLGSLSFGAYKAYAYYSVQSKINNAKKLQTENDFSDSLSLINSIGVDSLTNAQKKSLEQIKTDDQRFTSFKTTFDSAIALENPPSADNLQTSLKDLQSIDVSYPDYKKVQTEIVNVQNLLVTSLQNDAATNKAEIATAKAQAASASAAKTQAEAKAQEAQNEAATTAANAQAQAKARADQAQTIAVEKSFINQLAIIHKNFGTDCLDNATQGIKYDNAGDYSNGGFYMGAASNGCIAAKTNSISLNSSFSNMPQEYSNAANDMSWAAYYITQSLTAYLASDYTLAKSDVAQSGNYENNVTTFLNSTNP